MRGTWRWSGVKEQAALAVAEDRLPDAEIAAAAGVSRQSLERWKLKAEFRARVEELRAAIRARVREHGIAVVENRVVALNERWRLMQQVIAERGAALAGECPGGGTGLLVRQVKQIGQGRDAQVVEEFAVDAGLLRELRGHEEQAARELGQWTEKRDVTTAGEPIKLYAGIDPEQV